MQEDTNPFLNCFVIIADNKKEALQIAKEKGYRQPKVTNTYSLDKGVKTEFIE